MPGLTGATIGTTVAGIFAAAGATGVTGGTLVKMWQDVMEAIYTDIKTNGVVTVAWPATPAAGSPGGATGGIA